ncbi:helix-turn-helix transcriptional regulator, partial [Rhodothermus marinus]|uniref:helix-turn-helix transcriptional regulator n=1 Tax=Rhodothermus marinus TaxID=29549 RepID=UPI002434418D
AGAQLFPNRDGMLLGRLLDFLKEEGAEELLRRFFERYWDERLQAARQRLTSAQTPEARLAALRDFLEEEGFMPEIVVSEQGVEIRECNCPFAETVRHTRLPCYLEARFFEQLLGREASASPTSPTAARRAAMRSIPRPRRLNRACGRSGRARPETGPRRRGRARE